MGALPVEIKIKSTSTPEQKREAWKAIQELSPDMADFITECSKEFGKLESVEVKKL